MGKSRQGDHVNLMELTATIAEFSGANRPIRLRLSHGNEIFDDLLLVQQVSGTESLCGGLDYRLLCVSTTADLPLKQFIACPVELQFVTDQGGLRTVCGIVSQAAAGQSDGGFATYQLIVRDGLALMEHRTNTRVFRSRDELEITRIIVDEWRSTNSVLAGAFDVDWSHVTGSYPVREFTMQHNESDASFLRRLWKQRGLAWFIEPGQASEPPTKPTPVHRLVLFDDAYSLKQNAAGTVRYHRDASTEEHDTVTAWSPVRTLAPGNVTRSSWDHTSARFKTSITPSCIDQGLLGNQFALGLDDYLIDEPGLGRDADDYRKLGDLRMKRHEFESKCFHGEGSVRSLCVGQWIGLIGHPEIDNHPEPERLFVITQLGIHAENNLPRAINERIQRLFALNRWGGEISVSGLQRASRERGMRYTNRFSCVRRGTPIVPAYDARTDLPRPRLQSGSSGPATISTRCRVFTRKSKAPFIRTATRITLQMLDVKASVRWCGKSAITALIRRGGGIGLLSTIPGRAGWNLSGGNRISLIRHTRRRSVLARRHRFMPACCRQRRPVTRPYLRNRPIINCAAASSKACSDRPATSTSPAARTSTSLRRRCTASFASRSRQSGFA